MPLLQQYRYFQPIGGRQRRIEGVEPGCTAFSLVYSGMIPAADEESTEEILERLVLRHGSETRPHARDFRPVGAGDVFDLTGRGLWQVLPVGFRPVLSQRPEAGAAN